MPKRRFAVLDRDGTIIYERRYLANPQEVELIPGAAEALKTLADLGFGLCVATNQAGLGRGFFDRATLDNIHRRMGELLENEGVRLDGIYVCPHLPADKCSCRKPGLGLMDQAGSELNFNPAQSFVIGDKAVDIEFGQAAGARTILVRTGYGAEVERGRICSPDYIADDLPQAAHWIRGISQNHGFL